MTPVKRTRSQVIESRPPTEHAAEKTWWLYLLACKDGRTYAGIALDPHARFLVHRSGKGAKFTRANPPLRILGLKSFGSKGEALRAEIALKRLKRPARLAWAKDHKISVKGRTQSA